MDFSAINSFVQQNRNDLKRKFLCLRLGGILVEL